MTAELTAQKMGSNPKKNVTSPDLGTQASQTSSVRRSIGNWESGKPDTHPGTSNTSKKVSAGVTQKPKTKATLSQDNKAETARRASTEVLESSPKQERQKVKYTDRLAEAKACVTKAKLNLGNSRNIKGEIKTEVIYSIERLYQLVKEGETIKGQGKKQLKELENEHKPEEESKPEMEQRKEEKELIKKMEEHKMLIQESNERMEKLKEVLEKQQEVHERQTYANVAASSWRRPSEQTALHSVVITAKDETETSEEVLQRIRDVVNAKEGGIAVEKIRKAKDRKVILGCRTEEERQIIKERLKRVEDHLTVQEVKNKNPLVILRDVFRYNSDEDILSALWNQNQKVLKDTGGEEKKIEILYKKRARNPQTHHVIMRVSPTVWKRLVESETVLIDLQRVRVGDQSPLVQCSLCLGYGHGRRFCKETIEKCSHCGGPHMKTECADWLANAAPACCNCMHAKLEKTDHNAFSNECSIRRKWDALARATVAYC